MKNKILIATHNQNKLAEIIDILGSDNFEFLTLKDLDNHDDLIENGQTFFENALIKARHYFDKYNIPTISDDSGLCVRRLNGNPGVNSKRFSIEGSDYHNNLKLLSLLHNQTNRKAYFETSIVLINKFGQVFHFKGRLNGVIHTDLIGDEGFGYDPLFIPEGYNDTLAILGEKVKNKISHRSIAVKKLQEKFNEIINNR